MRLLRFCLLCLTIALAGVAAAEPSFVPILKTNFPDAFVLPHGNEFIA